MCWVCAVCCPKPTSPVLSATFATFLLHHYAVTHSVCVVYPRCAVKWLWLWWVFVCCNSSLFPSSVLWQPLTCLILVSPFLPCGTSSLPSLTLLSLVQSIFPLPLVAPLLSIKHSPVYYICLRHYILNYHSTFFSFLIIITYLQSFPLHLSPFFSITMFSSQLFQCLFAFFSKSSCLNCFKAHCAVVRK